jgi:hypothetical protein
MIRNPRLAPNCRRPKLSYKAETLLLAIGVYQALSFFTTSFYAFRLVTSLATIMTSSTTKNFVVATRIHLGNASKPPSAQELQKMIASFTSFGGSLGAGKTLIAADATPKFDGYDLVKELGSITASMNVTILPVTPWNAFVPALNAIVSEARGADYCVMVSAETRASPASIEKLLNQMDESTLVAGGVLLGHEYHPHSMQPLNGRTTPWNTLAVWNVAKLSLTGFALVADGVHRERDGGPGASGVEEVSTIAILQRILGENHAKAKLVPLADVRWETDFADEERRAWHERKMNSKTKRASRHLELLSLSGIVHHLGDAT